MCLNTETQEMLVKMTAVLYIGKAIISMIRTCNNFLNDQLFSGLITSIHCYNVNWAVRAQNVFTFAKLLALVILIGCGIYQLIEGESYLQSKYFKCNQVLCEPILTWRYILRQNAILGPRFWRINYWIRDHSHSILRRIMGLWWMVLLFESKAISKSFKCLKKEQEQSQFYHWRAERSLRYLTARNYNWNSFGNCILSVGQHCIFDCAQSTNDGWIKCCGSG